MSRWRLGFKILTASIVIGLLVSGVYIFLNGPVFRVHDVVISLDDKATHNLIFTKIEDSLDVRLKNLNGRSVWRVDLEEVLKKVEADLRVKSAKVSRILPDKIKITVTPHTPIASIMGDVSSKIYPISRDGELLMPVTPDETPEGPILRGQEFLREKEKRLNAIQILLELPEAGLLSQSRVSEIYFDKKKGYHLLLAPTGVEVWLGTEDFHRRLSQASRVIQYLEQEKMSGRIIDARFAKKVVVRLRNEP